MRPGTSMNLGADIKEKMRSTLLNVQTYQTHKTNEEAPYLTQSLKQSYKTQSRLGIPK